MSCFTGSVHDAGDYNSICFVEFIIEKDIFGRYVLKEILRKNMAICEFDIEI